MKNSRIIFILFLLSLLFCITQNIYSQVTEEWVARYTGPGSNTAAATDMAIDSDGNIYVAGWCYNNNPDYCVVKYDPDGNMVWDAIYDSGTLFAQDYIRAMALDSSGNVYVTGSITVVGATVTDYATVKFDKNGNQLWVAQYDGGNYGSDNPHAIYTDRHSNVYITGSSGYSLTSDPDYATVKYDSDGNEVWVARYKGPDNSSDIANAIAIDESGNVVVTGVSTNNMTTMTTIKYDANGIEQWVVIDSARVGQDMVLDSEGNIYITGQDYQHPPINYVPLVTIKYDPNGNTIWKTRYCDDNPDYQSRYKGIALALDRYSNVYVIGSNDMYSPDYITIKYDENGNQLWVNLYNGTDISHDQPVDIKVDELGNAYVTGDCRTGSYQSTLDYSTVKYDSEGNLIWVIRYDGPLNGADNARALELDTSGDVYVTGTSNDNDIATIKYVQTPMPLAPTLISPSDGTTIESDTVSFAWQQNGPTVNKYCLEIATNDQMTNPMIDSTILEMTTVEYGFINNEDYWWRVKAKNDGGWGPFSEIYQFSILTTGIEDANITASKLTLNQNFPNPFNPSTTIRFEVPKVTQVKIKVYDIHGREVKTLVNRIYQSGSHSVIWDSKDNKGLLVASGAYVVRMQAGEFITLKKMMLLK